MLRPVGFRAARTVTDSGPSVASNRSTCHRTGLPAASNNATRSKPGPGTAGAAAANA
jgi:hypothetical protein